MMKKTSGWLFRTAGLSAGALAVWLALFAAAAYAYNDGILENMESVSIEGTVTDPEAVLDNDPSTYAVMDNISTIVIELDQPYVISSIRYNGDQVNGMYVRFYHNKTDTAHFKFYKTLDIADDTPFSTADMTDAVRKIAIRNVDGLAHQVAEIELYGTPVAPAGNTTLTATAGDGVVNLSWTEVDDAKQYVVQRGLSSGGPFTTLDTVTGTTYADTAVTNGTAYHYRVTPANDGGSGQPSAVASATPVHIPRALLNVYLVSGLKKEYDLTLSEAYAFVNWYDVRSTGSGPLHYLFQVPDENDPGIVRKQHIVYNKIVLYEMFEY